MREIIISAGHNLKDPGAVSNGVKESDLAMEYRDVLAHTLRQRDWRVITPSDVYSVRETIKYCKLFPKLVVIEIHFNAFNGEAEGVEAFCGTGELSNRLSGMLVKNTSKAFGLRDRGVKRDTQSKRRRLGLIRELKNSIIFEVCFMDNPEDMAKVEDIKQWAKVVADTIESEIPLA
jgi:N-acetylmuramoyl-L-alanine amidase